MLRAPLPYLPSTLRGWIYYLSSALVIAFALMMNTYLFTKTVKQPNAGDAVVWNEAHYTFLESDYPPSIIPLAMHPRDSALVVEDTVHYRPNASAEWASLFPAGSGGFVRLGPQHRLFGVSMFHQLHCLDKMRRAVLSPPPSEWESWHTQHCLNYVRQMLLCAASTRVEPVKRGSGFVKESPKVDGLGLEHKCRDWGLLRRVVEENYNSHWPDGVYP